MKKEDLIEMLNESKKLIENNNLTYHRIRQLWIQINCLKQTVEDMVKPKTREKNEINDGF